MSQINTVTNIKVLRQNVFSHARCMVIGASSVLKSQNISCLNFNVLYLDYFVFKETRSVTMNIF